MTLCVRVAVFLAVLAAVAYADGAPDAEKAVNADDAKLPQGVVMMSAVRDALLEPMQPLLAKNTFSAGNKVVITRSNIIISQTEVDDQVAAIEDLVVKSEPDKEDQRTVLAVLNVLNAPRDDDKLAKQVRGLLLCRADRPKLHKAVVALVTSARRVDVHEADTAEARVSYGYRTLFRYPYSGGFRYGWRYPLSYWKLYGRTLYPGRCGFGRVFGSFFYC